MAFKAMPTAWPPAKHLSPSLQRSPRLPSILAIPDYSICFHASVYPTACEGLKKKEETLNRFSLQGSSPSPREEFSRQYQKLRHPGSVRSCNLPKVTLLVDGHQHSNPGLTSKPVLLPALLHSQKANAHRLVWASRAYRRLPKRWRRFPSPLSFPVRDSPDDDLKHNQTWIVRSDLGPALNNCPSVQLQELRSGLFIFNSQA